MLTVALLVVAACPARSFAADDARFAPETGLKVERTATRAFRFELGDWSCRMNGQDVPEQYLPQLNVTGSDEAAVRTLDTYLASAAGKPTRLRREFASLSAKKTHEVSVDDKSQGSSTRNGSCALQGCTVSFDETAGDGERRKLEKGECEHALLDALAIDLDLTAFLPTDGTARSWEVPASALNPFDPRPGGIEFVYDTPEEQRMSDPEQLARNVDGNWHVERGEARDEAGAHVLPLKLSAKFTTKSEIDSELKNVPVASGPTTVHSDIVLDVKGELLWDAQRHVLHSLSLEGKSAMKYVTRTKEEKTSGTPVYEQDMAFHGDLLVTVETHVAE